MNLIQYRELTHKAIRSGIVTGEKLHFVELLEDIENECASAGKGSVMQIVGKQKGFTLAASACECCQVRALFRGVKRNQVKLIKWERLTQNKN
jgi:hypothetical protein